MLLNRSIGGDRSGSAFVRERQAFSVAEGDEDEALDGFARSHRRSVQRLGLKIALEVAVGIRSSHQIDGADHRSDRDRNGGAVFRGHEHLQEAQKHMGPYAWPRSSAAAQDENQESKSDGADGGTSTNTNGPATSNRS